MKLETLSIERGGRRIAGLRYVPDRTTSNVVAVLAHGFTSAKHSMDGLASYLAGHGITAITFDMPGHKLGATGGSLNAMSEAAETLRDVATYAVETTGAEQIALIGHSMGGACALQVAAWNNVKNELPLVGTAALCVGLGGGRFRSAVGKAMLEQRRDYVVGAPAEQLLAELRGMLESTVALERPPILLIAAKQDVLVATEQVERLRERIGANATLATIDAQHLDAPDRARVTVLQWLADAPHTASSPDRARS